MCQSVIKKTPVERLKSKVLEGAFSTSFNSEQVETLKSMFDEAICYEDEYLKRHRASLYVECYNLRKENRVLQAQSRIITEYALSLEGNRNE